MTTKCRMVRAILIDPFACTVSETELDAEDYTALYPLLSHPTMPVDCYTAIQPDVLEGRDCLFVDDEGLLKDPARFFTIDGFLQPLAGKGLILGAERNGDTAAAITNVTVVAQAVKFLEVVGTTHMRFTIEPFVWEWLQ